MGILDFLPSPPSADLPGLVPAPVADFLGVGGEQAPTYNAQLPSYRSQLVKKYAELSPDYATLTPEAQAALLDYDAGRVARGQPPLTREQSMGAIETIRTGRPATPAPDRSPLDFISNAVADIGDIVKSVPRLPAALLHEATEIPNMGQYIADAEAEGKNALQALAGAPGVRLLPGAYTVGNIAGGPEGLKEAASHPVMSLLDVLPGAEALAKGTAVGARAAELAAEAGRPAHALQALATKALDADGNLVRNSLGEAIHNVQANTKVGQFLDAAGGKMSRDVMRAKSMAEGKIQAVNQGLLEPATDAQRIARDVQARLVEQYPAEVSGPALRRLEMDDWADATPEELAYRADYTELNGQLAELGVTANDFGKIYNPANPDVAELVPADQARRVWRAQQEADHWTRMAGRHREIIRGSQRTLEDIAADARKVAGSDTLPQQLKRTELQSIAHEVDSMGHDATPLREALRRGNSDIPGQFVSELQRLRDAAAAGDVVPTTRYSAADLITTFQKYGAAGNRQADRLVTAIRDGNADRMAQSLDALQHHATKIPELVNDPAVAESIRSLRSRTKYRATIAGYTDEAAAAKVRRATKRLDNTTPARFVPKVREIAQERIADVFRAKAATPEQAAQVTQLVLDRNWAQLPEYEAGATEKLVRDISYDAARQWRQLQESGFDPQFVHHVDPRRIGQAMRPDISEVPTSVSQVKARALDASPHVLDASVSISHAANEYLRRAGSEEWIDSIVRGYGTPEQDLRAASIDRARRYAERHTGIDAEAAMQAVMAQSHTLFDAASAGYNWGGNRLNSLAQDRFWIPKALASNLERMHDPKSLLGGLVDPITKAFRVSVIGLSPRSQLYNIMGGATMTMGEIGVTGLLKHLRTGMEYARNPEAMLADERISAAIRASLGTEQALFGDLDRARFTGRVTDATDFMRGRTLGRVWQQIQEAKTKTVSALPDVITGNPATGAPSIVQRSYNLNGLFDDAYKITTYLSQHDKSVGKGLSKEAAELAGLELMRKTQPDWAALTPIERSLMKGIFPFYGFMQHSLRYVFRYPMDHPLRANILASFGRAELEDNSTLPGNFLSNLFIGDPNSHGRSTALSLAAFNPFGDIANSLTVAGWISATNPALQTAFEAVGLDRGSADLYPSLRYDPESGRLTADSPNLLQAFLGNTIPQSQIATALLGVNSDYSDRLRQDPWTAYRSLLSNLGLPLLWRGVNIPQEQAKAEAARQKSASTVLTAAQKSGDWSEALRYPSLAAYLDQIRALTPEQLAPFQPRPDEAQQLVSAITGGGGSAVVEGPAVAEEPVAPPAAPVSLVANTGGF